MRTVLCAFALTASQWALPAHGQTSVGPVTDPAPVFIEVQADGQHCVIRKATVACSEVLTHLRQILKLAPGTWVRFKAARATPFEAVKKILDDVSHSEFATSAAYVENPQRR